VRIIARVAVAVTLMIHWIIYMLSRFVVLTLDNENRKNLD